MSKTVTEGQGFTGKIHPDHEDADFMEMLKVDRNGEYSDKMGQFEKACKSLSLDELDKKIDLVSQALQHVDESLQTQLITRANEKLIDPTMRETAFQKALLQDELKHAEKIKLDLIGEQ